MVESCTSRIARNTDVACCGRWWLINSIVERAWLQNNNIHFEYALLSRCICGLPPTLSLKERLQKKKRRLFLPCGHFIMFRHNDYRVIYVPHLFVLAMVKPGERPLRSSVSYLERQLVPSACTCKLGAELLSTYVDSDCLEHSDCCLKCLERWREDIHTGNCVLLYSRIIAICEGCMNEWHATARN